jgi:dihydroflavonol-4-reductase
VTDQHVLVTGATGFLASHLVRELLADGRRVRGTVRSLARVEAHAHLRALDGAAERLELVEADLLVPGSFDAAAAGVTHVFHTASPYALDVADPRRDLIDPAVRGTTNVLGACAASPTVRRVVLTSSFAAIADGPRPGHVFTEADWNTTSSITRNAYSFSKAEAERAAWAFLAAAPRHFDLVAVNPTVVIGPALGPGTNTSNQIFVDVAAGAYPAIMALDFGIVDVRDVAVAHVRALDLAAAHGRYLCAAEVVSMRTIVSIMREVLPPTVRLPRLALDHALGTLLVKGVAQFRPAGVRSFLRSSLGRSLAVDAGRARAELGVPFRPARDSIVDTVRDLVARGDLRIPAPS